MLALLETGQGAFLSAQLFDQLGVQLPSAPALALYLNEGEAEGRNGYFAAGVYVESRRLLRARAGGEAPDHPRHESPPLQPSDRRGERCRLVRALCHPEAVKIWAVPSWDSCIN